MRAASLIAWWLCGALASGCTKDKAAAPAGNAETSAPAGEAPSAREHADEPEHEELPKRVRLTPEVIAGARIKTAPVARAVIDAVLELPGEIAADPDKSARVAAPLAGRIERVAFAEGSTVKARALLAVVRVPELADRRATIASLAARASATRANVTRLEALAAKGLAAAQELTEARAAADALDAEATGAAERMRVVGASGKTGSMIELRAPIAGTVIARDAVIGQPVDAEHPIATIVDLGEVWFLGRVFERDLARVRVGAVAEVQLNAYPEERFEGRIEYLGRQIDPVARTVVARVRLANKQDLLRLGLFGTARISAGGEEPRKPSLVVPRSAVTEIGGKTVVFVRHPDDDFELHDVVLGQAALGRVEVLSGLREGEAVVTEGAFTLKSLVLKSTFGEEE